MAEILVVEDTKSIRTSLSITLTREGHSVDEAATGEEALSKLEHNLYDLVISDLKLGGNVDGLEILRAVKARESEVEVVIVTAFATVAGAVEAMKEGSHDYLTKPFTPEQILHTVGNALERRSLRGHVRNLNRRLDTAKDRAQVVCASQRMVALMDLVKEWAPSESTILITGETGTGKDVIANAMSSMSSRKDKPFVVVNCAAIPENLFESELFGHVRGAFSGATRNKKGLTHEADGGTLFLDEIGEMPLAVQAKLLRFLETGEIRPIGQNKSLHLDVRVVAATNRDLNKATAAGEFREDLFYRLNVLPLHLPPLRERREDIGVLAAHFLERYLKRQRKDVQGFSKKAHLLLQSYDWPGNVRELENVVERAVMLARGPEIRPENLLLPGSSGLDASSALARAAGTVVTVSSWSEDQSGDAAPGASLPGPDETDMVPLAEMERRHILGVLKSVGGNQKRAVACLGISKSTLWRKLKEYGVDSASIGVGSDC